VLRSTNLTSDNNPGALAGGPVGDLVRHTGGALVRWLACCLRGLGKQVFAINDAEAGWQSWQAVPRWGGLCRRYRDPRFDILVWCPGCDGGGVDPEGALCAICNGTGRLIRECPASASWR
jgi:hypothetical protein